REPRAFDERRRAQDRGLGRVAGICRELRRDGIVARACCREEPRVGVDGLGAARAFPDERGGPRVVAIRMTLRARVRHAELDARDRVRNAEGVIAACVDAHVRLLRHVAVDALRSGRIGRVEKMLLALKRARLVALQAEPVARYSNAAAVRVVAVRARHQVRVHLALQERARYVDFLANLAVRVVETLGERAQVVAREIVGRDVTVRELGPQRMASRAYLDLRTQCEVDFIRDGQALRRRPPDGAHVDGETAAFDGLVAIGPGDVRRAGAVAGLAADVDLGPLRVVPVALARVVFRQVRRMTARAARVPVLEGAGPVQRVCVIDLLVGVEAIPALAAFGGGPAVPGDAERLQPSVRKFDEVLLERIDTERVG